MADFSPADTEQIQKHGLNINTIKQQIQDFKTGFPYANIASAATSKNGIKSVQDDKYEKYFNANRSKYKIVNFVPASGAATRMFKDLFEFLSSGTMNQTTQTVLDNLTKFAFYPDLCKILPNNATPHDIIKLLITERGLNYGNLPKALLKFHTYSDSVRTALEEHLVENVHFSPNIHFTVSPEHISGFNAVLKNAIPNYEDKFNTKYDISLSCQKPETDTIAVNPDNTPFRNADNTLLFRPAGHGALIENLNDINTDFIFIKNIDNICNDSNRYDTLRFKKILTGMAMQIQQQIFDYIAVPEKFQQSEIINFINNNLGIKISDTATKNEISCILNRPLRVCGMVKNIGAPGGGPFWVHDAGTETLQIVEQAQIAPDNQQVLSTGEYFNSVFIACAVRNWRGEKFDLTKYVDPRTGFIAEKSKDGRPLRAMERPGLWNGAMANWNTVFVETPLTTFNPAKIITDLLKTGHKTK